jgi:hypothetical protein
MNHTPIHYVIGFAALALAGSALLARPVSTTIVQPVKQATASGKINPYAWGELEQREVNALQKQLETVEKKPVTIFCSDSNCQDITLDFDNAFESAHWSTDIQRPMIDDVVGLWTSSQDIADAIARATGGRLTASVGPWRDKDGIALAIGKKPPNPKPCKDSTDFLGCAVNGDRK